MKIGNEEWKETKHESFALAQFSRSSSSRGHNLFGSSIEHCQTITLRIMKAKVARGMSEDNIFSDHSTPYIEIEMSQNQFAELITSLNMGSGVPVTLRYLNGKRMEECPHESNRKKINQEIKEDFKEFSKMADDVIATVEALMEKPTVNKGDKKALLDKVKMLKMRLETNIPFVHKQFDEFMDKTVAQAKGEVEAFVSNIANKLGIKELKNYFNAKQISEDKS